MEPLVVEGVEGMEWSIKAVMGSNRKPQDGTGSDLG